MDERSPAIVASRLCACVLLLAIAGAAGSAGDAGPAEPVAPKLTPRLQELLRQEMVAINAASHELLNAMIAGDDANVATVARRIRDSYIMRQSMTPEDEAHLKAVVPQDFLRRDRELHEIADGLAEAADAGDRRLQHERFGQMIAACGGCHARYATDRFPGFAAAALSGVPATRLTPRAAERAAPGDAVRP